MKKYLLIVSIIILLVGNLFAEEGTLFNFEIYQIDLDDNSKHLIHSDSFNIVAGKSITGFVGPFSMDIELLSVDTIKSTFNAHIITLGPSAKTYSKSFSVEYGLPARIENIECKNSSEYLLLITPQKFEPNIDSQCNYSSRIKDDFAVNPTAYTEIYYVKSTLGDFYWDVVKEQMESNYQLFREFLNLNIPGKIHIYVPPCPVNSIIWDKRFVTSVDPTRNSVYAVFSQQLNSVDPFIINHVATLRTFGYTSPFISEGLANYFSFAIYDMKKILKAKTNLPLIDILTTYSYLQADASIADKMSSTFTRYLIDTYSLNKYLELYKKADDINLATTLQETYNKSISDLEHEWLTYIDTLKIPKPAYAVYAGSAEMLMKYDLMHTYNIAYLELAEIRNDSLRAFMSLKRSSFFTGDYYKAADYQQKLIDIMPVQRAADWMGLGAYELMNGLNEQALSHFMKALEIDSTDNAVKFNLSLYYYIIGDIKKAKEIILTNFSSTRNAETQGESKVLLADILSKSGKKSDLESAGKYYQEGANRFVSMLQRNNTSPATYMWLGKSYLGLYEYDKAINSLLTARFIETRPFYLGMIDLWLGQAYAASHNNKLAEEHLSLVISSASSVYHQKEAKVSLEQLRK